MKSIQFKDKYGPYALVAGGSDGLGAAFAEDIARRGLHLILLARQKERLEGTASRLRGAYKINVVTIAADLADWEDSRRKVSALNLPIGLLVYNAAFAPVGLFENTSDEHLALTTAVNVRTPLLLTRFLLTPMIQGQRGGIVLVSSLAGGQGSPNIVSYAATKSYLAILAEGLWKEMKPRGIDVLATMPGAVRTPGYRRASQAKQAPGTLDAARVAKKTLDALGKRPIVIPGAFNKIGRFALARILSRKASIAIMSKNTGGLV